MKLPKRHESGQAILIVLLSMAVVLTISLYIVSRTVTDISLSGSEEESQRAFSAAEAGIERALIVGTDIGITQLGEASFKAQVTGFAEGARQVAYPYPLLSGESVNIWFVSHDLITGNLSCSGAGNPCFKGSKIKICWGDNTVAPIPALEASIIYLTTAGNYATVRIARAAFDDNAGRRVSNNFADPGGSCTIGTDTFQYSTTLNFSSSLPPFFIPSVPYDTINKLQFMVLKLLYNDTSHHIGIDVTGSGSTLPSQGMKIDSAGTSGAANRRVEVFQAFAEAPSIFSSVVFSGEGVTK